MKINSIIFGIALLSVTCICKAQQVKIGLHNGARFFTHKPVN
jgi:hypothetical protein